MKRRRFLSGLLGLALAPALIEKVRVEPKLLHSRKVFTGDFRVSQDVLDKLQRDGFAKWADKALTESSHRHMAFIAEMYL